jgi:conjugal transfer pilus assembly protein TraW
MQFYNLVKAVVVVGVCAGIAGAKAEPTLEEEKTINKAIASGEISSTWLQKNNERIDAATKNLKAKGLLSGYDTESKNEAMQKYRDAAKLIAESSQDKLASALQKHVGLTKEQSQGFSGKTFKEKETDLAIFVSFSMPKPILMDAFATAAKNGANVYFNGIHPDHEGIHDTMRYLSQLGAELKEKPMVKFNPREFKQQKVTSVPMIMYRHNGVTVTASGLMNFNWIKTKHSDSKSDIALGNFGPVYAVLEENIIDTMKRRLAGIDMEGKKKAAVEDFWKKQAFVDLKPAEKDERWLIDPTVKALADVVNPAGDVLAYKGQIINPLATVTLPLTMYIIDAKNIQQLEWLSKDMNDGKPKGRIKVMTTRIDKDKGWDHLSAIREHLGREVYIAPKEVIERFKVSGTPAKISTDLARKMMAVEQFSLGGK